MTKGMLARLVWTAVILGGCSKGGEPTDPGPSGPGSIQIVTIPGSATASVIINNATSTAYTPALFSGVDGGPAAVDLRLLGYADTTVVLSVPAGGTVTDTVRLRPLPGTPTLITEVWGGFFNYVGPMAASPSGNFYVTANSNLISVLAVLSPAGAILHQEYVQNADANPAYDIALDSRDFAYVVGTFYGDVVGVFNSGGSFTTTMGRNRPIDLDGIRGIAVGPGDTIHVSATYGGSAVVEKYSPSRSFVYAFATGSSGTRTAGPIEVATDGTIYVGTVASASTPQIRKYAPTGALLQSWTVPAHPERITRGPGGSIYVTSFLGGGVPVNELKAPNRMEVYSSSGTRLAQWAIETATIPYLDRHAVDASGNVYMPLRNNDKVLKYSF